MWATITFEMYLYKLVPHPWETLCLIDRDLSLATKIYLTGSEQRTNQAVKCWFHPEDKQPTK